jgi:hypothetical protein
LHEHSLIVSPLANNSFDTSPQLKQAEQLCSCFAATKAWYNNFLFSDSFPSSCYPQLSLVMIAQFVHCMIVLFRLSTFEAPGVYWDRQMVLNELNFGDTMDAWVQRLEAVAAVNDSTTPNAVSSWALLSTAISALVKWWKGKIEPKIRASAIPSETNIVDGYAFTSSSYSQNGQSADPLMDFPFGNIDPYDDSWMRDLFVGAYEL